MKKRPLALSLLILFLSLSGCAETLKVKTSSGTIQGKEILVADNNIYPHPIWCGGGSELVYMPNFGDIASYNIRTSKSQKIAERSIMPLTCTQDVERLIYLDSEGIGWEDGSIEEETMGLWSYDFEAKEHRQLAIVYTNELAPFGESILSPDGKKLLLGKRPKKSIEPTEPTPKVIWSETKRAASSFTWLADSSGVVSSHWNSKLGRDVLDVSTFDPEKKAFTLDPGSSEILLSPVSIGNALYMKAWDGKSAGAREIVRCALDQEEQGASCETLFKSNGDIINFYILPDGETVVFTEKGGRCVKIIKRGDETPQCITPPGEHFVHNFSVSPDASLVAYTVKGKLYYRPFETEPKWGDSSAIFKEDEEGLLINRFKEHVKRDADTLYLKTESGAYRTYTNSQGCDPLSWCDYRFVDYFDDVGFYLLSLGTHERDDYLMISDREGKEYFIRARPHLSPDRGHLLTLWVCSTFSFCDDRATIWRVDGDEIVSEYTYKFEDSTFYAFVAWQDDKSVKLLKLTDSTDELCPGSDRMTIPVVLRFEEGGWQMHDDLKGRSVECGSENIDYNQFN